MSLTDWAAGRLPVGARAAAPRLRAEPPRRGEQDKHPVGMIYVDLPPEPCRSVEQWFIDEDYNYPDSKEGALTIEAVSATDVSFDSTPRTPGAPVTVEVPVAPGPSPRLPIGGAAR